MVTEGKAQNRSGRGIRRIAAASVAIGLAFTGVIAGGAPAFAAEAPAPISAELAPGEVAYAEVDAVPAPTVEVVEEVARPLGMSIFLVTAVTAGAAAIAVTRVAAARRQTANVTSRE